MDGGDTADFGAVVQSLDADDTEDLGLKLAPMYDSSVSLGTDGRRSTASPSELLAMLAAVNGSPGGRASLDTTADSETARQHHTKTPAKSCLRASAVRGSARARVAFGSPKAAQYHTDSPSMNFTPMSKRATAASFSMDAASDADASAAEESAETSANSSILQAWGAMQAGDEEEEGGVAAPTSATSRRRRSSGSFRPAPTAVLEGEEEEEEEESDSPGDSEGEAGEAMDTRESLSPTAAAAFIAAGVSRRRRSSVGGVKRAASPAADSSAKRPRASTGSPGTGLQPSTPSLGAARRRSSLGSPRDLQALLATQMLEQGEEEVTFAGTPTHHLNRKQLQRVGSALRRASRGVHTPPSPPSSLETSRLRHSVDGDVTEELGDLMTLLRSSGGGVAADADAEGVEQGAASDSSDSADDEGDVMDTRQSLSPSAALAAAGLGLGEAHTARDAPPSSSSSASASSTGGDTYDDALAEEEALLLEAGVTPTRRSSAARTMSPGEAAASADRISVAASVRAAHLEEGGGSPGSQGGASPPPQPTALTFDGVGTSPPPAHSAGTPQAAPTPASAAEDETPQKPTASPASVKSVGRTPHAATAPGTPAPPTPAWGKALKLPGLVSVRVFLDALGVPAAHTTREGLTWESVAATPSDRDALLRPGLPDTRSTVQQALLGCDSAAAAWAVQSRVLLPHSRAVAWAASELAKQVAVAGEEVEGLAAEASRVNPPLLRKFKGAVVAGGPSAAAARDALRGAYLQHASAAATRFQGWKVKMAQAVTAAFEKGLRACHTDGAAMEALQQQLAQGAAQLVAAAEATATSDRQHAEVVRVAEAVRQATASAATARAATDAAQREEAAQHQRLVALRARAAALREQVAAAEADTQAAEAATAAVADLSPEAALQGTVSAREHLQAATLLGGWCLAGGGATSTALQRQVLCTTTRGLPVALGSVTVQVQAAGGASAQAPVTVRFQPPAQAPVQGVSKSQREQVALASYLAHQGVLARLAALPPTAAPHTVLRAVATGTVRGSALAGQVLSLAHSAPVTGRRGSPLPPLMQPGQGLQTTHPDPAKLTVTLTHRSQRGKVQLDVDLPSLASRLQAAAVWRIGGKGRVQATVQGLCEAAHAHGLLGLVAAVDALDFSQ